MDDDLPVDALSQYEDIVNEVLAGRTEGHKCPVCTEGELDCSFDEVTVRIKCRKCGRFFEGMLA